MCGMRTETPTKLWESRGRKIHMFTLLLPCSASDMTQRRVRKNVALFQHRRLKSTMFSLG